MAVVAKMSKCQTSAVSVPVVLVVMIGFLTMAPSPVWGGLRGSAFLRAPETKAAQKEMEEEDDEKIMQTAGDAAEPEIQSPDETSAEEEAAMRQSDEADEDEEDGEQEEEDEMMDEDDERLEAEDKLRLIRSSGAKADADKDGRLSAEEMLRFAETVREEARRLHTDEILKGIDADQDGSISMKEAQVDKHEDRMGVGRLRFDAADGDKDGALSREELVGYLHPELQAETLEIEIKSRLQSMDADKDAHVSLDEFLTEVRRADEGDFSEEDAKADFEAHDADKDGKLNSEELAGFVRGDVLLWAQIEQAMAAGDEDSDGYVHLHKELPRRMDKILDSEFVEDYFMRPAHHQEL